MSRKLEGNMNITIMFLTAIICCSGAVTFGEDSKKTCPKMETIPSGDASLVPFQVSASKRSGFFPKVTYHPIMRTMSPDRNFDWEGFFYGSIIPNQNNNNAIKKPKDEDAYVVLPITLGMISKLGIRVLSNRRACFAGKQLRGVIMPKNRALQMAILRRFLVWYLPCLELQGTLYHLNNDCFMLRENKFLAMFFHALGFFWNPIFRIDGLNLV